LIEAIYFLHKRKLVHGDIRPCFIFYDQTLEKFKLVDRLGNKKSPEETQRENIREFKPLYMSPKLFE
jgi:serine/threonine protein kinase